MVKYDAVIVGGGVIGSAIAYYMAGQGARPLVLEKDRLASQSSGAAAGMLAAQAELDVSDPLYEMARQSRDMFPALAEQLREYSGLDIGLVNRGMLKVALTPEQERKFRRMAQVQRETGEPVTWLSAREAREREPGLSDAVLGAIDIPADGHVSAPELSRAFALSAAALGADIREYAEVVELEAEHGQISGVRTDTERIACDRLVVTSGAWTARLLRNLGVRLPVYPVKGELFSVLSRRPLLNATLFSEGCYIVPKKGGRIIVGATMCEHSYDRFVSFEGIRMLMEKAKRLLPSIAEAEWETAWAGLRPQTPDGLPYMGEHPEIRGLYAAAGHFRNGILLSPLTGKWMADLVLGRGRNRDLPAELRLDRAMASVTGKEAESCT